MSIFIPIVSEFKSDGIDKARKEFASLGSVGAKASYAIKKAALPAAAAIGGLAVALGDAVKGAMEDAAATEELARTLKISGQATDAQIASIEKWISYMGKAYGVADDDLRPALADLTRSVGDATYAQELLQLSMNVAAGTGKDLGTVAAAIGKAANGSTKGLKSLDASLIPLIKDGASTDELFKILGTTFEGATAQAANTAAGKMQRLTLALSETKESIGAALLPALEAITPPLLAFGNWAQENPDKFLLIAGIIGTLAGAIVAANVAMKVWNITTALTTALNTGLATSFTALQVASGLIVFTAIIAGLIIAYKKFEWFRDGVKAVFNFLGDAIGVWVDAVKFQFNILATVFKTVFNSIATLWNNTFGKLSFKVPGWVPGIGGKGFDVPNIPMLAQGGIVMSPTLALIGEAGPEAVVPLDRMGNMGGGNTYQITVQGGDPNAIVDALRRYMRQNGSVPIKVAS